MKLKENGTYMAVDDEQKEIELYKVMSLEESTTTFWGEYYKINQEGAQAFLSPYHAVVNDKMRPIPRSRYYGALHIINTAATDIYRILLANERPFPKYMRPGLCYVVRFGNYGARKYVICKLWRIEKRDADDPQKDWDIVSTDDLWTTRWCDKLEIGMGSVIYKSPSMEHKAIDWDDDFIIYKRAFWDLLEIKNKMVKDLWTYLVK